jgi:hypothetical protein
MAAYGAFTEKHAQVRLVARPHHQFDFQRATIARSLQGIGPKIGFDGRPARFCRQLIFEFFNDIGT